MDEDGWFDLVGRHEEKRARPHGRGSNGRRTNGLARRSACRRACHRARRHRRDPDRASLRRCRREQGIVAARSDADVHARILRRRAVRGNRKLGLSSAARCACLRDASHQCATCPHGRFAVAEARGVEVAKVRRLLLHDRRGMGACGVEGAAAAGDGALLVHDGGDPAGRMDRLLGRRRRGRRLPRRPGALRCRFRLYRALHRPDRGLRAKARRCSSPSR